MKGRVSGVLGGEGKGCSKGIPYTKYRKERSDL